MKTELTKGEKQFIINILGQIQIKPMDPEAKMAFDMIQAIGDKLKIRESVKINEPTVKTIKPPKK